MDMTKHESFERFQQGLKKAISRCRELGAAQKNMTWHQIALSLEGILSKGESFYRMRQISQSDSDAIIEQQIKKIQMKTGETSVH